jgi:hypothetical protein
MGSYIYLKMGISGIKSTKGAIQMLKRNLFLIFFLSVFLAASNLYAYSYCYEGCFQAPEVTASMEVTGGDAGMFTAYYAFSNLPTDYGVMALSLNLDRPYAPVANSQTSGWQMGVQGGNLLLASLSDQVKTPGELRFAVNVDLSDGVEKDWHQSFLGVYTKCVRIVTFCGTIDRPGYPVAEPGTMILLCISMLTLAGYGTRQMKR